MRPQSLLCLALAAGCLPRALPPAPPARDDGHVERRLSLMGTWLDLAVDAAGREAALAASERAVAALAAAEARLSTWRAGTELARLNRAPVGEPQELSPALAADLGAARRCWEETGGAFDPAVGALVAAWDLRGAGRVPAPAELRAAVAAGRMEGFRLQADGRAVRLRGDLTLEEGGFGKGAGLADAVAALAGAPGVRRALLDLGGQIAVFGRAGAASPGEGGSSDWSVAIADPRRRDRPAVALAIAAGSVSTSGNSERGFVAGGRLYGHILDPRSGEPAPDFGSLTVWTADPLRADCLSTGLFVLGPERALAWAAAHPGVEVIVLRPRAGRLEARASPGLRGRLWPLAEEVDITFSAEILPARRPHEPARR
jgi:FAD:protein FMN transferase